MTLRLLKCISNFYSRSLLLDIVSNLWLRTFNITLIQRYVCDSNKRRERRDCRTQQSQLLVHCTCDTGNVTSIKTYNFLSHPWTVLSCIFCQPMMTVHYGHWEYWNVSLLSVIYTRILLSLLLIYCILLQQWYILWCAPVRAVWTEVIWLLLEYISTQALNYCCK